tara:strand:- start:112 stop:588 length:477 start_codon:yes stop_codon:yes gene_type:complete
MNSYKKKYISILFFFLFTSCSYKPIFTQKDYSFEIKELLFIGDKEINRIINNKLKLVKKSNQLDKKQYNLTVNTAKTRDIISKDSKGDPAKFEMVINVDYEISFESNFVISKKIEKKNIYNNDTDKFNLEQNEKIILQNLAENISDIIISSLINLDDN